MMRRLLILLSLLFASACLHAQLGVKVLVVDFYTNEPLESINYTMTTDPPPLEEIYEKKGADTVISHNSVRQSSNPIQLRIDRLEDLSKVFFPFYEIRKVRPTWGKDLRMPADSTFVFYVALKSIGEYDFDEVVLPSSMKAMKSPSSMTQLVREDLQRDQQISLAPVLNRVPGVYMHMGTLGTSRLTIRGIGARSLFSTTKVKAYVENIPLSTGDGETSIEDLDLPLIDNITVVRGPASSLFGAGLGGALLMESDASILRESEVSGLLQYGSFNTQRASLKARAGDGSSGLGIHAHYLHSDGWRENSQYDRFQASLQAKFLVDDKSTLSILGTFVDVKGFIPSSIDSATFAENPGAAAFTWKQSAGNEDYYKGLLGINYRRRLNHAWTLQSSMPLTYRANDELRPFDFLRETALAVGNRTVLEGQPRVGGKFVEVFLGEESFHEFYAWQTYQNIGGLGDIGGILSNNREERKYVNAFAQVNYPLAPKLDLTLGSNFNKTWYNYEDFYFADSVDLSGNYSFNGIFSPRAALRYQLGKEQYLHAQASHGFSPPLLSETLTPEGQINPEIQPETGWNYEIGAKGQLRDRGFSEFFSRLSYSFTAYWLEAANLLVPRRVGNDQFVGINAGQTRHLGLETEFDLLFVWDKRHSLNIWGNYSFMNHKFVDFSDEEAGEVYDGNFLPGIPMHNGSFGLKASSILKPTDQRVPILTLAVNAQLTSGMPLRDNNILYSEAYQVWNAKLSLLWLGMNRSVALSGGVQNIFNAQYASMILVNAGSFGGRAPRYFYPGMPRNFYVDLQFDLKSKK